MIRFGSGVAEAKRNPGLRAGVFSSVLSAVRKGGEDETFHGRPVGFALVGGGAALLPKSCTKRTIAFSCQK